MSVIEWKSVFFRLYFPGRISYWPLEAKLSFQHEDYPNILLQCSFCIKTNETGSIKRHMGVTLTKLTNDSCWMDMNHSNECQTVWSETCPLPSSSSSSSSSWIRIAGVNPVPLKKRNRPARLTVITTEGGKTPGRPVQQYVLCRKNGLYRMDYCPLDFQQCCMIGMELVPKFGQKPIRVKISPDCQTFLHQDETCFFQHVTLPFSLTNANSSPPVAVPVPAPPRRRSKRKRKLSSDDDVPCPPSPKLPPCHDTLDQDQERPLSPLASDDREWAEFL